MKTILRLHKYIFLNVTKLISRSPNYMCTVQILYPNLHSVPCNNDACLFHCNSPDIIPVVHWA